MASKKGKKAEKQNKTPEVVQAEERPVEKEIVPGKGFYENDWAQMLDKEEDLLFICDLVEEVFEKSCVVVVHRATEKETYPYSVQWAKQIMLDKIKCFFIECDDGEADNCSSLIEDLEPPIPVVDSWARGVVPMMEGQLLKSEEVISDAPENEEVEETLNRKSCREETAVDSPGITDEQVLNHSSTFLKSKGNRRYCKPRIDLDQTMKVISPPPHENSNGEKLHNESVSTSSHTPFSSTAFINIPPLMSGGPDPKLKIPHKHSQVLTDQFDRVIETIQLDSRKFPSPSIKPVVTVQRSESFPSQPMNGNRSTGHVNTKPSLRKRLPPKHSTSSPHTHKPGKTLGGISRVDNHRVPREPTLPPFLDIIDPLPGVTVYENGQSLTGPVSPRSRLWSPGSRLQPITPFVKKTQSKLEHRRSKQQSDPFKLELSSPLETCATQLNVT